MTLNKTDFRSLSSGRIRSGRSAKSPPNSGPGRLMTVSLKDDITTALRTANSSVKLETLEKMRQCALKNNSLGKI